MSLNVVDGRYTSRRLIDYAGTGLTVFAVLIALVPLGAMMAWVIGQGGSSLDLNFFTQVPRAEGETGGGMINAILGTIELVFFASLIGLPVGIMTGVYLARAGSGPFAQIVRFVSDVIAGTPSIVAGMVAYALIVLPSHHFSAFSASVALALLMFPTVARATESSINLVPAAIREAGLALGLPEWKTMARVILPTAASGIVTAVMLGIARVAGETAPLLFTALGNPATQFSPSGAMESLPHQIYVYATSPYSDQHRQAWAGAFVLFAIIVILNLTARLLTRRLAARTSAA
ncbi:MAG TPA: phosphate ABC transporter permease PstA [Chloroflexota bacterium]